MNLDPKTSPLQPISVAQTFNRDSLFQVQRLVRRLPLVIGLIVAGAILVEFLVAAVHPLFLQWVVRFGYLAGAVLVSRLMINRWAQPTEGAINRVDQQLLAMNSLVKVALEIVSELDENRVLQNIAQRSADLVGAPFGCVFLRDEEQDAMRLVAQTPYHFNLTGKVYSRGIGVVGKVVETGKPAIVNNYSTWEKRLTDDLYPLDAFIGIPLKMKNKVIGSLSIGDEMKRRTFQESDIQLLQPFADLAAIAINNSRLYGEIQQLTTELEKRNAVQTVQLAHTQEELIQKTVQLQGLLKRLTKAQESERARIAHDMHDSTTQLILAAVYATQAAINGMDANPSVSKGQLQTVLMLLHQIEIEIREAIRNLRPIILDQEGVAVALKQYIDRLAVLGNLECEYQITGTNTRLPEEFEVAIYRIVQEALQNIVSHAQARHVSVGFHFSVDHVEVSVEDDGIGFEVSEAIMRDSNHFGLAGMRERAESIGATFEVISGIGEGTRILLNVPHPHPVHQ